MSTCKEDSQSTDPSLPTVQVEGCEVYTFFCPTEPLQHFRALKTMEVRPDDVFLCNFPKTGSHWTWEIVSMLLRGSSQHDHRSKLNAMPDIMNIEAIDAIPSPRVLNSHFPFRFLPWKLREKGARIIVVSRNPKDVAVSSYHHVQDLLEYLPFEGSFSDFIDSEAFFNFRVFGLPFLEYEMDWEKVTDVIKDLNILFLKYEDMKEDILGEVRKMNEFLGTSASESLMSEIAAACSFKTLKEVDKKKQYDHHGFFSQSFRAESRIYRKGEVGDWKNWFTQTQSEHFDRVVLEKMKHSKITYRYTL